LESALRRAAAAHGEHEKRIGDRDENWPKWYAEYIVEPPPHGSCLDEPLVVADDDDV